MLVDAGHYVGAVARTSDNALQLPDRTENDGCTGLQARDTARSVIDAHASILNAMQPAALLNNYLKFRTNCRAARFIQMRLSIQTRENLLRSKPLFIAAVSFCLINKPLSAQAPATSYTLSVTVAGTGSGTITSSPAGISCKPTCNAPFGAGSSVKLTVAPAKGSYFAGWSGACKGTGACALTVNGNLSATATFNLNQTVKVLNHIIFMMQENRGLDHYFGALRQYWRSNRFADISFDGLPQFNPASGNAPLYGPPPTNPGCDPASPPPNDCIENSKSPSVASYHLITQCIENPSPSWNEGHVDWNLSNPISGIPALDGYVYTGAHDARNNSPPFYDVNGI